MKIKGSLTKINGNSLIGFDAEWTKNYREKNGNVPFCFSLIEINKEDINFNKLIGGKVVFNYIQYYCDDKEELDQLVAVADVWSNKIIKSLENSVLCGHQISSDFSVLYNIGIAQKIDTLSNIEELRKLWKNRREYERIGIVDTRYDISKPFLGKSRRLVDMCNDFMLDVTQPELKNKSMTKLQNQYYENKDEGIYERIAVMNLRHSLCATVLYWLNIEIMNATHRKKININQTIYNFLKNDFKWVKSEEFKSLI